MEEFSKEKKDIKNIYLPAPLLAKCDYLLHIHYFNLE